MIPTKVLTQIKDTVYTTGKCIRRLNYIITYRNCANLRTIKEQTKEKKEEEEDREGENHLTAVRNCSFHPSTMSSVLAYMLLCHQVSMQACF